MKRDIESRKDVECLINSFYEKVQQDEEIGFIFNDVAKVNWEKHLPVMYNFWEGIIFFKNSYTGNPMQVHMNLHNLTPLRKEHFNQWLQLFNTTVDELFEGDKAMLAKERALGIATLMQIKIIESDNNISVSKKLK